METAGKLVEDEKLKEVLKEKGLGTPATRAAIIETLLERGYITQEKKTLLATDLGRYLIALVQDRGLKSPELTGEWGAKLREVERGGLDPRQFMTEIVGYTDEVIRCGDATSIDEERLGDCPRCGRPVIGGTAASAAPGGGKAARSSSGENTGAMRRGRPDPTAPAATGPARPPRVREVMRSGPPAARHRRVDGDSESGRRAAAVSIG